MALFTRSNGTARVRGFLVWAILALTFGGYPLAWILFSPKSVLRSTEPGFVYGFGAGVGMAVGMILGGVGTAVAAGLLKPHPRPPAR
jgi:hypothetical protein